MPPTRCPYVHSCSKYTDLTLVIDRKDKTIERLRLELAAVKAENARLKAAQCGGAATPAPARPFGSSTPSSKIPVKENSTEENRRRAGGRPKGHAGSGREKFGEDEIDEKIELPKLETCPECGHAIAEWTSRTRDVVHTVPARHVKRQYTVFRAWCPQCRKYHETEIPGVMPNFTFSNALIAQTLVDHYRNGVPMGTLARRAGIGKSALYNMAHTVAHKLEGGMERLLEEYACASVKHADETPWSSDGRNGYAWGFFTLLVSLYRFRGTRGAEVPREVFGKGSHAGVLVVDRYSAYPGTWNGKIQYCLEHFKRNVRDLLDAEPNNEEYKKHIPPFLDLLREAMTLRGRLKGGEYDSESRRISDALLAAVASPVKDGKLKGYFDLMSEKRHRFFQWVEHPEVEAENNLAERRLRPLVIARKVCFGSQSDKGLKTRETLMSIIDTLSLRNRDPVAKLTEVLDALARNPEAEVNALLWGEKP